MSIRDEYFHFTGKLGISLAAARAFLRAASAEQRSSEIECSIRETDEQRERRERIDKLRHERIGKLATEELIGVEWQGDPRGCPLILHAGDGVKIHVPAKGLPARCFR